MKIGDEVQVAYDFWITEVDGDILKLSVDVNKDLHQTVYIPRCIPAFQVYPSYMDYKVPEDSHIKEGTSYYKVVSPPGFRLTGIIQLKGVREVLDYPLELKNDFERDMPMGKLLNLRFRGSYIKGVIDRIFVIKKGEVTYQEETITGEERVVFVNLETYVEYELSANLLI